MESSTPRAAQGSREGGAGEVRSLSGAPGFVRQGTTPIDDDVTSSFLTAETSALFMLDLLEPGMRVLDVGSGSGMIALDFAEIVAPGIVVGVEPDPQRLELAKENAERRGDHTTAFTRSELHDLPFDDGTFDLVHAHQLLQRADDPVCLFREFARVCAPSGHITVSDADVATMMWYPEATGLDLWRKRYVEGIVAAGGQVGGVRRLRAWANEAGLTDAFHTARVSHYADQHDCEWWGYTGAQVLIDRMGHALDKGEEALMREAWRTWAHHPDAMLAIVHAQMIARAPRWSGTRS